jgi:hypothetical protein
VKLTRRTGVSAGNRGARRSGIAEHSGDEIGDEIGDARSLTARTCSPLSLSLPPSLPVTAADYTRTDDGRVRPLTPLTTVNRNPWSNNNQKRFKLHQVTVTTWMKILLSHFILRTDYLSIFFSFPLFLSFFLSFFLLEGYLLFSSHP